MGATGGAPSSAQPAGVAGVGNPSVGKGAAVLRLKGGGSTLKPAQKVAGKRVRDPRARDVSLSAQVKAARKLAESVAALEATAAVPAERAAATVAPARVNPAAAPPAGESSSSDSDSDDADGVLASNPKQPSEEDKSAGSEESQLLAAALARAEAAEAEAKACKAEAAASEARAVAAEAKTATVKGRCKEHKAAAKRSKNALDIIEKAFAEVDTDSDVDVDMNSPADALAAKVASLASQRAKATSASVSAPPSKHDVRRPKPFNGEGEQDSAGAVRRFTDALELFFNLSGVDSAKWAANARLYLEGSAFDYMRTALKHLPMSQQNDWSHFCALLSTRFGQIDPDAEFWDQLEDLKQGSMTASEYVHKMRYCFNGITELPSSDGEKIHRFLIGLNPKVKQLVVTAPVGMGNGLGKWTEPDSLMQHTVLQACGLPNQGAVSTATAAGAGQKRAFDKGSSDKPKKQKKTKSSTAASPPAAAKKKKGGNNPVAKPFCSAEQKEYLSSKNLCYHCCKGGHPSYECKAKANGEPAAPMPSAFKADEAKA